MVFQARIKNRFRLCSCRGMLPATASRAVSCLEKTQWAGGKPGHWKKDQHHHVTAIRLLPAVAGEGTGRKKALTPCNPTVRAAKCCLHCCLSFFLPIPHGQRMGNPVTNQGLTNTWQQKSLRDICPKQNTSTDSTTGCERCGFKSGPCFISLVCEGENGQDCKR